MRVIGIYPGRFHPFHKGHAASFKQLAKKFGLDNTYLAISAKQEQPKSPFSAQDRAKMAMALGIPSKNIIAVRNPYAAQEYIDQLNLDPEKTAIVFGVSKKDMEGDPKLGIAPDPRFSFNPKRDGSPSYLQPYGKDLVKPMSDHGYVMSTDVAEFPIAGKTMRDASAIRKAYAGADDKTKMRILRDLYGDAAEKMKQVFDNNLQVTESIRRLIDTIKPMLSEATVEQKAKFVQLLSEARRLVPQPNIMVAVKELERTPNSKIIKLPGGFAVAGKEDPRPEVRPNYKVIEKTTQLNAVYNKLKKERDELMHKYYWPYRQGNPDFRLDPKIANRIRELENQITLALKDIKKHKDVPRYIVDEKLDEYNVRKTKKFIQKAHDREQGQQYGSMPYSSHPKAVAAIGKKFFGPKFTPEAIKVALLHDVLEDTPYTPEQLAKKGFSPEVIEAVQLLTKDKSLSYADNIRKIINSKNPLAMMVKYCDNYMNYTGDKSHWSPERAAASQKKYLASLNMLGDVLGIKKHVGDEEMISEAAGTVYSASMASIIEDLGNGYFLGDDSYDDDEGFTKEGYSVYHLEGPDQYRLVGHVQMSPYRNEPGAIEASIQKLITTDQNNVSENMDYLEEK